MSHTYEYPRPAVTVDAILYALQDDRLYVLLIRRKNDPFAGKWAFPGGFMDMDEAPEAAVKRELAEETGIEAEDFIQLGAFGAPDRDPRHRTISIAYIGLIKGKLPDVKGADDAADARWFEVNDIPEALAFDHEVILEESKAGLKKYFILSGLKFNNGFGLSDSEIQKILIHL